MASSAGKMTKSLWLANRAGKTALSFSLGTTRCVSQKRLTKSHVINPISTKLVHSSWLDIGLVPFCVFMDFDSFFIHKHAKKELNQYPATLNEEAWSITNVYYMASSVSGQDEANRALWLATRAGKMEPSCPLGTTRWIPQANFHQKPYNKSFIDQVCSVKMAGYWPGTLFTCLWTSTSSRSINTQKKNLSNIQPSWPNKLGQ